jgi:flagellar hook assembly protein FlgD
MRVSLGIYDVSGRRVRRLIDGDYPAGQHALEWDLKSDAGTLQRGVFYAMLHAGGQVMVERMTVIR